MGRILILAHYFPPFPGVGGRRWAKFVKYLCRNHPDVYVHVISSAYKVKDVDSSFDHELEGLSFKHTSLDAGYPKHLVGLEFVKKTFWHRVMFRIQLWQLKRQTEGNYWDFSVFYQKHFQKTIPDIIKNEQIDTIIVSGTPFRYAAYTAALKTQFPELQVVLDYRDPWNDFNNPYNIGKQRLEFERKLEFDTLRKVDKILAVSKFQEEVMKRIQPNPAPVFVLPNGFDPEDIPVKPEETTVTDEFRIAHFGTMHGNKPYYWVPFFDAIKQLKSEKKELYAKLRVDLIGYIPAEIKTYLKNIGIYQDISDHGILKPHVAFEILSKANHVFWFKYDGSPGDFATKFGDYIALKKYIWCFSKKGAVTDYIEENRIGHVFYRNDENLKKSVFEKLLQSLSEKPDQFNPDYDPQKLNIENLTKDLISFLYSH